MMMMNEIDNKGNYNETDKNWSLHRVYNYHLHEFRGGQIHPAFVDYHEFLFDVLENELHKTPLNLHNREVFIFMVEQLRHSIIGVLKKDCLRRGKKTNNREVFDDNDDDE